MTIYTKDHYSLRRFLPADWAIYKIIRLEALKNDPAVFGSNYDKEFKYEDEEWRSILENPERAFFGLFHDNTLIGVTGVARKKDKEDEVILVASYIHRTHRGKGLSELFYKARLDWARNNGYKHVIVSHRISNEASKAANQKHGFRYTHSEKEIWPDGIEADQLYYVLDL